MSQLQKIYFAFSLYFHFNRIDLYTYKETTFLTFHLTVKIDLVEVVYYLKQVFHLLYDKIVWPIDDKPAEALLYFSII